MPIASGAPVASGDEVLRFANDDVLAELRQGEPRIAQFFLEHRDTGDRVALLAFVHRHRRRHVGKLATLAGVAEVAAVEGGKLTAVSAIVALRLCLSRQHEAKAESLQ